ncbi:hypothetical protein EYF80_063733 [Liparis tanakae]|uniref:Uncharacterized protein n=1 Tax=Liparis tanakae TaxID=230148 RepID=A0A4Z2EBD3_9TELE|nr:hypothetical protein EYF80_063733 [Liparis tanakae]
MGTREWGLSGLVGVERKGTSTPRRPSAIRSRGGGVSVAGRSADGDDPSETDEREYMCVCRAALTVATDAAREAGGAVDVEGGHLFGHQGHHAAVRHLGDKRESASIHLLLNGLESMK